MWCSLKKGMLFGLMWYCWGLTQHIKMKAMWAIGQWRLRLEEKPIATDGGGVRDRPAHSLCLYVCVCVIPAGSESAQQHTVDIRATALKRHTRQKSIFTRTSSISRYVLHFTSSLLDSAPLPGPAFLFLRVTDVWHCISGFQTLYICYVTVLIISVLLDTWLESLYFVRV